LADNPPETGEEMKEAISKIGWDLCEVYLEVIDKNWFGLFHKDFLTEEKWVAKEFVFRHNSNEVSEALSTIAERLFSVDTRLGEDYDEKMTQAFEDLMGELFQQGWELSEDATPYTRPIYLHHPPAKRRYGDGTEET